MMANNDAFRAKPLEGQCGEARCRFGGVTVTRSVGAQPVSGLHGISTDERNQRILGPLETDAAEHSRLRRIENAERPRHARVERRRGCGETRSQLAQRRWRTLRPRDGCL